MMHYQYGWWMGGRAWLRRTWADVSLLGRTPSNGANHNRRGWTRFMVGAAALVGLLTPAAQAGPPFAASPHTTIIWFTRHAEDIDELGNDTYKVVPLKYNADGTCYVTALNPLGMMRAIMLADWFEENHIAKTLTHVIASHKIRTRQTVGPIAQAAGLTGDSDQAPGDGVFNVPWWPGECDAGWTSSKSVIGPQTNFINTLPLGSRVVLCSHSPALYPIMQAYGIDTSDPVQFPKDAADAKKVGGFTNLWAVELRLVNVGGAWAYQGRLLEHLEMDFLPDVSRLYPARGNGPGYHRGCTSSDDKD
jgi:hypothetical protein